MSSASVWEIAIKAALGRLDIELDDLEGAIVRNGFQPLSIEYRHAVVVGRLPAVHRDPFDRMLVAQATVEAAYHFSRSRV